MQGRHIRVSWGNFFFFHPCIFFVKKLFLHYVLRNNLLAWSCGKRWENTWNGKYENTKECVSLGSRNTKTNHRKIDECTEATFY